MVKKDVVEEMFATSGKEPEKPKKPTLKQYLKELGKDAVFPIYSEVKIVWFPGNWDNFSIECADFRVSISTNHPLYTPLDKGIGRFTSEGVGMLVRVDDGSGTISLAKTSTYGEWRSLGNSGVSFTSD